MTEENSTPTSFLLYFLWTDNMPLNVSGFNNQISGAEWTWIVRTHNIIEAFATRVTPSARVDSLAPAFLGVENERFYLADVLTFYASMITSEFFDFAAVVTFSPG